MDAAFRDPVAPLQGEPGRHGAQSLLQPTGEAGQLPDAAVGSRGHPRLQVLASALPDNGQKGLAQGVRSGQARLRLAALVQIPRGVS